MTVKSEPIRDMVSSEIKKHLEPVQELLKLLEAPASKAGISPAELIQKMTHGGNRPGVFAPGLSAGHDGAFMPLKPGSLQARRAKGLGWGEMYRGMYELARPGVTMETVDNIKRKLFSPIDQGGYGLQVVEHSHTKNIGALAENSGLTGGYTVPPQFAQQLLQLAVEDSIVDPRASSMPLTNLTLSVPSLDYTLGAAGQTAMLGGVVPQWTSEAATRVETEPQFLQTELKAWELSFYTVASNNLLADNAVGLDSLLTQLFTRAISWYTDYAYLQGDGVGKPQGILGAAPTIAVDRATNGRVRYVDLSTMMSRLLMQSWKSAVWVAHQSTLPDLLQMNDNSGNQTDFGAGRLIWASIDQGAALDFPATILGRPVFFTEKVPALGSQGDISLIDFSMYLLGKRMEVEIAVSPHVRFLNNQMVWRVVWRGDGQPWLHNPITLADGTFTVSPFVTLAV